MKRLLLSAISAALLCGAAPIVRAAYSEGFVPPNDLKIPVGSSLARGIQESQFNTVLDVVQDIYGPEIAARGKELVINRLWTDATVNASAQQSGNRYIINMYGGLARHTAITMDGFALVACHELGHHLGGAPKKSGRWASSEGQSDYYANFKCLKKIFSEASSFAFTRTAGGDELAEKNCEQTYSTQEDRVVCVRGAMAGKSVANLFKVLSNATVEPSFDTPDPKVVPQTNFDNYPPTQCRMDTYLHGSLCAQPVGSVLSETDAVPGTCTRSNGFSIGFRPLCWYKPGAAELLPPVINGPAFQAPVFSVPGAALSELLEGDPWAR